MEVLPMLRNPFIVVFYTTSLTNCRTNSIHKRECISMLIKDATKLQLEPNACSAMSESKIFFMPFSCPPLVTS